MIIFPRQIPHDLPCPTPSQSPPIPESSTGKRATSAGALVTAKDTGIDILRQGVGQMNLAPQPPPATPETDLRSFEIQFQDEDGTKLCRTTTFIPRSSPTYDELASQIEALCQFKRLSAYFGFCILWFEMQLPYGPRMAFENQHGYAAAMREGIKWGLESVAFVTVIVVMGAE